jgi:ribonucleotide reductase alpha subunit
LHDIARVVTKNLNRIIDNNYYPVPETETSNKRHRPIGIGIQGLADALILMKVPFEDPRAEKINAEIFETIYHAAMTESVELAKQEGAY